MNEFPKFNVWFPLLTQDGIAVAATGRASRAAPCRNSSPPSRRAILMGPWLAGSRRRLASGSDWDGKAGPSRACDLAAQGVDTGARSTSRIIYETHRRRSG